MFHGRPMAQYERDGHMVRGWADLTASAVRPRTGDGSFWEVREREANEAETVLEVIREFNAQRAIQEIIRDEFGGQMSSRNILRAKRKLGLEPPAEKPQPARPTVPAEEKPDRWAKTSTSSTRRGAGDFFRW